MHLFIEVFTLASFLAIVSHATWSRGRSGLALLSALFLLGLLRENAVAIREILYGFAPLALRLGRAPLIATIIWGFSIYAALVFAEEVTGQPIGDSVPSVTALGAVALFMIALVGYPALAVGFLLLWGWAVRRATSLRLAILAFGIPALALGHAFGLQALKDLLAW